MAKEDIILRINPVMETGDIRSAVKDIEKYFGNMNLSKEMSGEFKGIFDKLLKEVDNFETKAQSSFKKASDVSALEKSANKIDNLFGNLIKSMGKLDTLDLEDLVEMDTTQIKKFTEEINKLKKELEQLTKQKFSVSFDSFKGISKSGEIKNFFNSLEAGNVEGMSSALKGLQQNVLAFTSSIQIASNQSTNAAKAFEEYSRALQSGDFNTINSALKELKTTLEGVDNIKGSNLMQFIGLVERIGDEFQEGQRNINDFGTRIKQLEDEKLRQMAIELEKMAQSAKENQNAITGMANSVHNYTSATTSAAHQTNQLNTELDEIKNRVKYFFSLESAVDLFRRGIQQAYETVKELDKVMTETAVVTGFSVGDMWDQLPQYSKMAKELGVSIQGVYEASTLYYQQGLKTEEVMALTEETLKMARIAGLDYAEATDLMTAALRGFNMEINQTSAQQVNDIYSKLAAITAADTEEIATAMTKTASIANSANMELETTAALLAQMIETTREPAETAGTAMKTIIARFTEMKKATSDIINVDGEEVNVNKVEAALKSAGVALRDSTGQFRNLDDVFLDLSKRWDSLDVMTQRYIATTAAGSRQQSRFIAMMQDYDRTMELVDAAYNSSGASSAQFMKTQDSLETKINNLKSAWEEFTMGLANSEAIKTVIDLITKLLETINLASKGTNGFSSFMSKMFIAISAFKIGKGIFNKMFSGIGTQLSKLGTEAGQQAGKGLKTGIEQSTSQGLQQSAKKAWDNFKSFFRTKETMLAIPISINFDENGKTSMQNFENELKKLFKINPAEFTSQIDNIGSTLENSIVTQLEQHGLNDEGRDWVHELVQGAMERLRESPAELSTILADLENQVFADLNDDKFSGNAGASERAEKDILENGLQVFDEALPKIEKTRANIEGIGTALASAAMTADLIVGGLEDMGAVSEDTANTMRSITSGISTAGTSMMALKAASDMFNISANLNPYIAAISIIIAGISMVGNLIKQNAEEEKKLNEQRMQDAKDSAEKTKQINDDTAAYEDMVEVYKETGEVTEDLKKRKEELIEIYDLEKYGIDSLTSSYEEVAEAMRKARLEQLEYDREKQEVGLSSSTNAAYTAGKKPTFGGAGWTSSSSFEVDLGFDSNYATLADIFEQVAEEEGMSGLTFSRNGNSNLQVDGLPNTPEGKQQWMTIVQKVMDKYAQIDPDSTAAQGLSEFWGLVSSYYISGQETQQQAKSTEKDLALESAYVTAQQQNVKDTKEFGQALNNIIQSLEEYDLEDDEKRDIALKALTETQPELEKMATAYGKLLRMEGNQTSEEIMDFLTSLDGYEIEIIASVETVIDENVSIEDLEKTLEQKKFQDNVFGDVDFINKMAGYSEKINSGEMTTEDYASVYSMLENIPGYYGGMDAQSYWSSIQDADRATQLDFITDVSYAKAEQAAKNRDNLLKQVNREAFTQTSEEYLEYNKDKIKYDSGKDQVDLYGSSKDATAFKDAVITAIEAPRTIKSAGATIESADADLEDGSLQFWAAGETALKEVANLANKYVLDIDEQMDTSSTYELVTNQRNKAVNSYNEAVTEEQGAISTMDKYFDEKDGYSSLMFADLGVELPWLNDDGDGFKTHGFDGLVTTREATASQQKEISERMDYRIGELEIAEGDIKNYEDKYLSGDKTELNTKSKILDANIRLFTDEEIENGVTDEQIVTRLLEYQDELQQRKELYANPEAMAELWKEFPTERYEGLSEIFGNDSEITQIVYDGFIGAFDEAFASDNLEFNFSNIEELQKSMEESLSFKEMDADTQAFWSENLQSMNEMKKTVSDLGIEVDWSQDPRKVIDDLKKEYDDIVVKFNVDGKGLEQTEEQLEALEEYLLDYEDIQIAIEIADFESSLAKLKTLGAELQNLTNAAALIEPVDYQVNAENFRQIAQMAPELLENHQNLSNGMIQLDKDVVDSYLEGQKLKLKAQIDTETKELEQMRKNTDAQVQHLWKQASGEIDIAKGTAENIISTKLDQTEDEIALSDTAATEGAKASAEMATQVIGNYKKVSEAIDVLGTQVNSLNKAIAGEGEYVPLSEDQKETLNVEGTYKDIVSDYDPEVTRDEYLDKYNTEGVKGATEEFLKWLENSEDFKDAKFGTKQWQDALDYWYNNVDKVGGELTEDDYKKAYESRTDLNNQAKGLYDNEYELTASIADNQTLYNSLEEQQRILREGEDTSSQDSGNSKNKNQNYSYPEQTNIETRLDALERLYDTGQIDALDYIVIKRGLLTEKRDILKDKRDDQLRRNKYDGTAYEYNEAIDDFIINTKEFAKLTAEAKEEAMREFNEVQSTQREINEVNDALNHPGKNTTNIKDENLKKELKALDRQYENGQITAMEWTVQRTKKLNEKYDALEKERDEKLAESQYDNKYYRYDSELDEYVYTSEFGEVHDKELIKAVKEEYKEISEINDEMNGIEDELAKRRPGEEEKENPIVNKSQAEAIKANSDQELYQVELEREELSRTKELVGKLPSEVQGPLNLVLTAEDMAIEAKEIGIQQEKLRATEAELAGHRAANSAYIAQEKTNGVPYYIDPVTGMLMKNEDFFANEYLAMEDDEEKQQAIDEVWTEDNTLTRERDDIAAELSGGKIQKIFTGVGEAAKDLGEAFKDSEDIIDIFFKTMKDNPLLTPGMNMLVDTLKALPVAIADQLFPWTRNQRFDGLIKDDEKAATIMSGIENSFIGSKLGDNTKDLIGQVLGGGTTYDLIGSALGGFGDMLTGIGSFLNFDMLGMGLDMFNGMKDMASQMIQYVVQFVQTIISWWINREDWLYNLLSAIEQEVHNFNRQEQVEERFRLYSDEGLNDLVSAWEAMRDSLEKQIDLNEQLIKSRQAELQFLNLTNLPFSPAFYYDYTEERVIENPWVYDIYVLLLDLGAMIPEIGGIFSSIKSLMEDNKKRMEEAVKEIEDTREEILELEKQQLELRTKYMEDEIELEELVMDSIIEKQQEEIDELSAMNDAISEGNEKLINTLNSKLDLIRQQRDNEDKEEELGEKERRLAYLRQDTSGANRKEIMDLSEDLKDERRDYTDELIDQKISALEEQNEKAAEQRQKQIDLLQAQLDYTEKYGLQWEEAQTLIKNGFDNEGRLRVGTDLFDMLMSKEDFTSMGLGSTRQVQQIMDWNVTSIAAAAFREINDIWDEGFGNFAMSNDVHDQSRLHLWADREVDYRQLPSWLSFLQPAYNTIQDYLWRTGNNFESFVETSILSDKNSTSIIGKTIVPLIQSIAGNIATLVQGESLTLADGAVTSIEGAITSTYDKAGYDWGERAINGIGNVIADAGDAMVRGIRDLTESNSLSTQSTSQTVGEIIVNNYINSEDIERGESIGENIFNAFREGLSNLSIFK